MKIKNPAVERALTKLSNVITYLYLMQGVPAEYKKLIDEGSLSFSWEEWFNFARKMLDEPLMELRRHDRSGRAERAVQQDIERLFDPAKRLLNPTYEQALDMANKVYWRFQQRGRSWDTYLKAVPSLNDKALHDWAAVCRP